MTDFNKIRYRALIEFLTLENVQPQQIHNRMTVVYAECAPSYAMVKRWAAEFRQGRNSLEDESWSGRPSEAVCEENCRAVENTVLQNRRGNVQLIADAVGISTGSVKTCANTCWWGKSAQAGCRECLTRKWRIVNVNYQVKIRSSCSWTGICFWSAL